MARKKQQNSYQTADEWMGRQSGGSTPGSGGTQSYGGMQTADEWMGANAGAELTLKGQTALQAGQLYQRLQDAAQVRARKTLAGYLGSATSQVLGYVTDGINRGWQAGSTDRVNQAVNDYKNQAAAYGIEKENRRKLLSEQEELKKQNAYLRPNDPIKAKNDARLAEITAALEETGTPEKPKRQYPDPREFANQAYAASLGSGENGVLYDDAAQLQQQIEKEKRYWQNAQKSYQPDSREYADAKARWEQKFREFNEQYSALGQQLPGGLMETKVQQQTAADIQASLEEAIAQRTKARDDLDIAIGYDMDVAGARQRYEDAAKRVDELAAQLENAEYKDTAQTESPELQQKRNEVQEKWDAVNSLTMQINGASRANISSAALAVLNDKLTAAREAYRDAKAELQTMERGERLDTQDSQVRRYDTDRYRDDFEQVAENAMAASLDGPDPREPVGYYIANQEQLDLEAQGQRSGLDRLAFLADDEISEYFFRVGKYGLEDAKAYLDTLEVTLDKRKSDYYSGNQEILYGTSNALVKAGMNAASVPMNVIGGVSSAVADVGSAITGNFNPYSPGHEMSDYANTVRGVTARDITENVKDPFWQTVWQNTYYAGMSALDSAMGAALFGNGYTAIMGASSASQRARELYEDGASGAQIALGAVASGAIEMATEKYSIEYFTSHFLEGDIKGFADWMKKTLIQGVNEMSEEVASELANQAVDALLRGANSDNNQEIQELMAQGMSEEEAKRQALVNRAVDVFWAGYGGFVSGAAMGGVGGAINKGMQNAQYKADGAQIIQNEGIQALIDQAKGLDVNEKLLAIANDRATRTLEQLQSENLIRRGQTQKALGQLYAQVTRAQAQGLESTARADVQQAAEQALAGQVENPKAAAEAATKAAFGEALTEQEQQAVEAAGGESFVARLQDTAQNATDTWLRTVGLATEEGNRLNPKTLAQQRSIVQEAAQGFSDPAAMVSAYRDGQDPALFIRGWKAAYANGQNGVAVKYSLDSRLTSRTGMTRGQIIAAHEAGRKAAGYGTEVQTAEGAAAEGGLRQGQEWNDMRDPGRKNGAVAEGAAAGAAGGQEAGGGADGAAAGGKVSAKGLGIRNGTAEENLTVRPREQYTETEKAAAEVAAKHGLEITIVQGGSIKTVEQVDGKDVLTKSRALIDGKRMIVRSDDPLFTPAQIARHEAAHWQIQNGEINLGKVIRQLQQQYSTAQIREMIHLYTAAYGNHGLSGRWVLEEMVCDAMGEMNAFATEETSTVAGEVGQFLRDLRKAALETKTEGQKNNAQEGVKYSIQNTQSMSWEDQVKGALYGEKNIRRNDTLVVGDVATALVQDGVTQKPLAIPLSVMTKASNGKDISHSIKKGKLANLDSGIKNAPIVIVNPSRNAIVYVTNIKQGGAPILAAFDMNAVFDGDEVHKATSIHIQINVQSMLDNLPQSATVYVQNENELAAVGATNNLRGLAANVKFISEGSITNRGENVKQKYSRELDSEYMELAKDPEGNRGELQEMVDQAAEEQGYKTLFYHGSKKGGGFTEFRDWQYFTPKKEYAERYAQRGNPDSLYSVFVKMENPFDTRNAKARRIFQEARDELGLGEIADTGLPDWTDGYDLADYIDENGLNYDAIVLDEGGDLVNGKPVSRGLSYVVRKSNQVKSADAVVYDDNGKIIPLSERFNNDKRDIRYSRELDSEGNTLTQEQTDFFADSEVRNDDGELIPVYHKTTESFTVFKRGKLGGETLGNASDASLAATSLIGHWFSDSENTPFMGNAMKTYLNIKKPYYTSLDELAADLGDLSGDLEIMQDHFDRGQYNMVREAARSYVRWMKWKGYDGLIVNDTETGGTSYVILNSNQAKLTDNGNPTSKRDIRYSRELETVEALKRQNELLQKQRDYWKEQTRTTDERTRGADKGEVRSLANQLIRQYSSKTEVEEILPEMQWLADSIWKNDPKISYTDLQDSAQNIARMVLDGSEVNLNAENWETGQELKRFLRGRYINVDESLKKDIGDFKAFKQSNRSLHFRENGTGAGVGSLWLELQNDFGKGLFPDSVSNPGDKIRHIADTLTSLTESDMQNPYAADMELTVEQMAADVMARAAGVNRQKATKADQAVERATEELNRLLKAGRTRERARIEQSQQTTYRQQIKNVSEKFQRMLLRPGKGATQHAPANLVGAVRSFCELFNDSEMRRAARWQLTLEERSAALAEQAARDYVPKGAAEEARKIGTSQGRLDNMKARLADLKDAYDSLAKGDYQNAYDDTVKGMIDSMAASLAGKDIYQLDTGDLLKVKNTMTALLHTVSNANQAFSMGKDKTVSGMAQKMASEMRQVNHQMPGLRSMAGRYWMWQKTPDVFFNYMCGYIKNNEGKVVQKAFQRGSEKMFGVQREFYQMFQEFTEGSKETQKELRKLMNDPKKNLVSWGLKDRGGNEVQTSRGMMMQAYMLLRQHDSFESLQFGGFSLPNTEEYYKGNVRGAYGNMDESEMISEALGSGYSEIAHEQGELREQIAELRQQMEALSPADAQAVQEQIDGLEQQRKENQKQLEDMAFAAAEKLGKLRQNIEEQLTPLERQLIDRATEWYAHTGKLMKDVFLEMYGYAPNLVDNYVPIHRDPATIKTDIRDMAGAEKAFNLENSSFTIDRVKNYQPILLTDFFQELEGQKEKMSRYVGFAQVQKDFGKLWKTRIGSNGMTINKLVEAKFGSGRTKFGVSGTDFVEHYIADIAGGHSSEDILGDFYGHYAAATLRLNPRVAVSQAASIPTAASVVGWKSAAVGFAKGLPNAMSTKYRNDLAAKNVWFWQRYRGQGGSTELADIRQKGGVIEKISNSKVGKKLFNWCQTVDVFSTGSFMWCMAEDYVQRTQGLKPGMEGYESAVNETYTDIIRKSQPNYTTTERSDLLRDKRAHMKMLTMFKTQSSQNLNLLMEANGEFMRARLDLKNGRNGVTEADVKAARAKLANAATGVFLGGTVAFVGLRTIMNFIMGAVNPYRDEETDEVTLGGVIKGMSKEVLSSLSGTIALGGQVYDLVMSVVSGDKYYGMSDSALATITELVENSQKVIANALDADKEITSTQIWNMANSWCQALGIPASNAKKIYNMLDMYIRDIRDGKLGQYTSSYTSKDQYRARVAQGVIAGETGAADDALAMLFAQSAKDTDEDIQKDIAAGMREYLKKAYMTADVTDLEAERILEYTGTEDPAAVVARWDFMLEKPEVDNVSDNLVAAYNGRGDLDGDLVIEAYKYKGQHTKEEVVKYIQSLEITAAQKRALWDLIKGNWKGKDTPWG